MRFTIWPLLLDDNSFLASSSTSNSSSVSALPTEVSRLSLRSTSADVPSSLFFSSRRRHTIFDCDWSSRRVLFRSAPFTPKGGEVIWNYERSREGVYCRRTLTIRQETFRGEHLHIFRCTLTHPPIPDAAHRNADRKSVV